MESKATNFYVQGIGDLDFYASLLTVDYSRVFVAKKKLDDGFFAFYLFQEIGSDENSLTWAAVEISYMDLDLLNRGLKTIESCFDGPFGQPKTGYLVTSKTGQEIAQSVLTGDAKRLVGNGATFADPIVPDGHGAALLSSVFQSTFISVVIDSRSSCSPLLSFADVRKIDTRVNELIDKMPYLIERKEKRISYSSSHSVVVNVEIAPSKALAPDNALPLFDFENKAEVQGAVAAIESVLSDSPNPETIIKAFKGDEGAIESAEKFVGAFSRIANGKHATISLVAPNSPIVSHQISAEGAASSTGATKRAIEVIKESQRISEIIEAVGHFLMIDVTTKVGRFKFKTDSGEGSASCGTIKGTSAPGVFAKKDLMVGERRYHVTLRREYFAGDFGKTDPVYVMTNLVLA